MPAGSEIVAGLVCVAVLVGTAALPARAASGDERWSGTMLREDFGRDEAVASAQEPVSFILNPRTRMVSSFAATVVERVRCLPPGEEPGPRDPRYADDAVESFQPRRLEFAGPVRIRDGDFELGVGRVFGPDDGQPGSWQFAANVFFDPVGNPGQSLAFEGFAGQVLSGGSKIASSVYDAGRCRTSEVTAAWRVRGPALPRLNLRATVSRAGEPTFRVAARALVTASQPPALLNDNPYSVARRADQRGRVVLTVDGGRPVTLTAQARGFLGRSCDLRVDRRRPARSRLRC